LPSAEYLRACLNYNSDTGELRWRERPREHFVSYKGWRIWNGKNAGKIAGNIANNGYRYIQLTKTKRRLQLSHRMIWKLFTGKEPPDTIDHIDGNPLNNAWRNLRAATQTEQRHNERPRKNISGYRGVYPSLKKWQAHIKMNGIDHYLGTFDTPEEASVVVESVVSELHGKFYRSKNPSD
jgi:hypothetical protein